MRILYLDLDTTRPDHLGCYGYHRNTSPNIDRIAGAGVRFENCHCSDAPCLPSRTALMTGRFGIHTGVVNHGGACAEMRAEGASRLFKERLCHDSLPGVLRRAGMRTASISPFAERHASWSFYAGFTEMHNTGLSGNESAEQVTPTALKWIADNAAGDNWFLHVNYWDPHGPYRAPGEFGDPFADAPLPAWLTKDVLTEHRKMVGPHKPRELAMFDNSVRPQYPRYPGEIENMDDLRRVIDGYDCGVAYMDQHVGQLFDALAAQGVMDDLVVVISADHGESLGELGIYGEHATADLPTTRIPMIVRWPGCSGGSVATGLQYNLDLVATLAELLGVPGSDRWDGRSFAPTILRGEDCGREYLVVSQCAHVCQRSVRFGSWLYVRTYHDGFHLFDREMLFDVQADPHEQHNLAGQRSDVCQQAVYHLNEWHDDMMATQPSGYDADPLWTVMQEGGPLHARGRLAEYCRYLERTGRGAAIAELKRRHPREFAPPRFPFSVEK